MSKTLIVSDHSIDLQGLRAEVLSFQEYLQQYPKLDEPKTRVINLCNTEQYLSKGYYCSLLAEARQHEVLPSVSNIIDTSEVDALGLVFILPEHLCKPLNNARKHTTLTVELCIYCGNSRQTEFARLANYIFQRCKLPIMRAHFAQQGKQWQVRVHKQDVSHLSSDEFADLYAQLDKFTQQIWRTRLKTKKYRWDMAILVNNQETTPPSDQKALKLFVKAASQLGINAQLVEYDGNIDHTAFVARFDALFIRETTAIKSHTYELARAAENAGVVVIDDPSSILRCCNKVFLHDAFSYHKVPSPRTMFVTDNKPESIQNLSESFVFPDRKSVV